MPPETQSAVPRRRGPGKNLKGVHRPCEECGIEIYAEPNETDKRFCSRACKNANRTGRELVQGTRYRRPDGYIWIKVGVRKNMLEHRLVMEQVLGRPLLPTEQVNHINHIRDDNRPENLELVAPGDHARESVRFGVIKRRKDREELIALRLEVAAYRERYGPLT